MKRLIEILNQKYPKGEIKMGGDFCFLENKGLQECIFPNLTRETGKVFYLGTFFTGMSKFSFVKVIIGYDENKDEVAFLCNPLFSEKLNSLINDFKKLMRKDIFTDEIIELLILTGSNITSINGSKEKFQIWFGNIKWRVLSFGKNKNIELTTIPNSSLNQDPISLKF